MMYNEFLELSGKSESYISYKEYTEEIEPIYMACDLPTKEDFIKAFNETFERIVYPIVENTISNFSTEEKLAYLYSFRREEMDESVRMFDRKARQIAYDYMKLYLMVAVVVKGGIVQQIGKGVVSRPETCFSGQPTKWAKDIYKKGHGPVPEVE